MTKQTNFQFNLQPLVNRAKVQIDSVVRKIVQDLGTSIVFKSPVGNPSLWKNPSPPPGYVGGRFRANWMIEVGSINGQTVDETDRTGAVSISRILQKAIRVQAGDIVYITNSLPYARRIEYGHSHTQAPAGVVGLVVAEFETLVNKAISQAKSKGGR